MPKGRSIDGGVSSCHMYLLRYATPCPRLSLRVESGDTAVRTLRCHNALYVAAGRDLDELLARFEQGKSCVLAMSHSRPDSGDEEDIIFLLLFVFISSLSLSKFFIYSLSLFSLSPFPSRKN